MYTPEKRKAPARFARIPSPPRIEKWLREGYKTAGGADYLTSRAPSYRQFWAAVRLFAVNPELDIADLEIVVSTDEAWNKSRNRSARERHAYRLGTLARGNLRAVVWAVPRAL